MAFPPILALALAGGAAYLLLAPQKKTTGQPQATPQPSAGPLPNVIQVPAQVITDHPDVAPGNAPTVTVQVPTYATGGLPEPPQVQTATPPGTTAPTGSVARLPDLPGYPVSLPPVVIPTYPIPGATATNPIPVPATATPATPVQHEETKPDQDPNGTVALAKSLIDIESSSGWKSALQSLVMSWQARMGLKADGKFGPGSAAKMALEVGVLPLIRYYPRTTQLAADLKAYRDVLYTMAANAEQKNPAHAAGLRSSAAYETGQAYSGTPKAIPASARLAQAAQLKTAIGA